MCLEQRTAFNPQAEAMFRYRYALMDILEELWLTEKNAEKVGST